MAKRSAQHPRLISRSNERASESVPGDANTVPWREGPPSVEKKLVTVVVGVIFAQLIMASISRKDAYLVAGVVFLVAVFAQLAAFVAILGGSSRTRTAAVIVSGGAAFVGLTWMDLGSTFLSPGIVYGDSLVGAYRWPASILGGGLVLGVCTARIRRDRQASRIGLAGLVLFAGWLLVIPHVRWNADKGYALLLREVKGKPMSTLVELAPTLNVSHLVADEHLVEDESVLATGTAGAAWSGALGALDQSSFGPDDTLYVNFLLGGSYLRYEDGLLRGIGVSFD